MDAVALQAAASIRAKRGLRHRAHTVVVTEKDVDIATVEQQYNQLQQEGQSVTQGIQGLAGKLKTAADGGSADAREWLLDLKDLALNIQQEQQQVMMLMQAMHQAV